MTHGVITRSVRFPSRREIGLRHERKEADHDYIHPFTGRPTNPPPLRRHQQRRIGKLARDRSGLAEQGRLGFLPQLRRDTPARPDRHAHHH